MQRVRTVMTGVAGGPYYSNHYFGGTDVAQAQDFATRIEAFWTVLSEAMTNDVTIRVDPEVFLIDEVTGDITGSTPVTTTDIFGVSASGLLPPTTQALIRWRTGAYVDGRRIQGRTYIPALVDLYLSSDGTPTSSLATILNDAVAELIDETGRNFGVWSRKNGAFELATSGSPWNQFAVLRSRRD